MASKFTGLMGLNLKHQPVITNNIYWSSSILNLQTDKERQRFATAWLFENYQKAADTWNVTITIQQH